MLGLKRKACDGSKGASTSSSIGQRASLYLDIGDCDRLCEFCGALFWYEERVISASSCANDSNENVLKKHVAFFDRNNDGVIYPWETFQGFRAIGSGILLSSVAAVFINVGLSRKTRPGKGYPNLLFPVHIANIKKAKHGSDSGVYDAHGRFVSSKFEDIFHKYARTSPEALKADELDEFLKGNREPKDYGGWIGGLSEWKILYYLGKDKTGLLQKDTIKGVYDGSLFEKMAAETAKKKHK